MIRLLVLVLALLAMPALAASRVENPHTTIEIIAETAAPAPGKPFAAGLVLTPNPGWHTYWVNPGDSGAPTRTAWTLPDGTAPPPPLAYPVPEALIVSGLMNHVYSHANTLLTSITPPDGLAAGAAFPVKVKVDWLVCSLELCVPESATLDLPLVTGKGTADPDAGVRIALAQAAVPRAVDWPATWSADGGRFVLAVPFGDATGISAVHFFPLADGTIDYAAPQAVTTADGKLRIETKADKPAGAVAGVLRIDRKGAEPIGYLVSARPGAVPGPGTPVGPRGLTDRLSLPAVLAFAVLGGILLNIMPCVFPILSLKALAVARGNVPAHQAREDALAYAAGVIVVCVALGAAVLGLRAAGSQIGWAFQLQDPRVIAALLLLTSAIALNLAGVFEITVTATGGDALTRQGGVWGSFWTGALAAFVATPCTGPFMAGALGAALVLPPVQALAVFAGLGLGLAIPFLGVGFSPWLRRRLPKPGAWMATLKAILSIPMFATALALAWILGRQAGVSGMTAGLAGALVLGLALWWLGARQRSSGGSGGTNWLAIGVGVLAAVAAIGVIPSDTPAEARPASMASALGAELWSAARLAQLRQEKRPVFVYFTADWCLTCKVNERGAMASADVARAFAKGQVAVLEGDWTRGDAAISAFLAEQGRAGVPLYLFYRPDGRVEELPQLLTPGDLTRLAG